MPRLPEPPSLAVESSRLCPGLYPVSQDGSARSLDPDCAPVPEFRLHLQLEAGLVTKFLWPYSERSGRIALAPGRRSLEAAWCPQTALAAWLR